MVVITSEDDLVALQRLRDRGDNLTEPRPIDFSVVFCRETNAIRFMELFSSTNSPISMSVDLEEEVWDVTVTCSMVPEFAAIQEYERRILEIAEPLSGSNDGWGCFAVLEK